MFDERKRHIENFTIQNYSKVRLSVLKTAKNFGNAFTNFGPKNKIWYSNEGKGEDKLVAERQYVLDSWKNEFEGLDNRPKEVTQEFDGGFLENIIFTKLSSSYNGPKAEM